MCFIKKKKRVPRTIVDFFLKFVKLTLLLSKLVMKLLVPSYVTTTSTTNDNNRVILLMIVIWVLQTVTPQITMLLLEPVLHILKLH